MIRRTCALCGERDAATLTDYDGRQVPACTRCLAPVADPPEPVDDLIAAIGTGERTFAEIARWLGVEDLDRTGLAGALRKRLQRLEAAGLVASRLIDPAVPRRGSLFRLTGSDPLVARVEALPPEFTARDLGCATMTEASGVIRAMVHRGLIEQVAPLRQQTVRGVRTSTPAVWRRVTSEATCAA